MKNIKFIKIRNVKSPNRGTKVSSGIDFYIPNDLVEVKTTPWELWTINKVTLLEKENIFKKWFIINPLEGVLIPSWIKTIIPTWYDLVFDNKSWISFKKWLIIWAKVIDSDYRWEIHLHLVNISNISIFVELWEKITQWIVRKVELCELEEVNEEFFNEETERWSWGFGSTGTI